MPWWLLLNLASAVGGLADLLAYLLSFNFTWLWLLLPCATLLHASMGASMREPYTQHAGSHLQIVVLILVQFLCLFVLVDTWLLMKASMREP
jgi:hypothetical protein